MTFTPQDRSWYEEQTPWASAEILAHDLDEVLMHQKPIIGVDVDGVLANLLPAWIDLYNQDYEDGKTLEDFWTFTVHEWMTKAPQQAVYDYLKIPTLYDNVTMLHRADTGVRLLRELGATVLFVTSNAYGMTDQKFDWLRRHGFIGQDWKALYDVIGCHQKHLIRQHLLIDDRISTLKRCEGYVRKRWLFHQPNNLLNEHKVQHHDQRRAADWKVIIDACDIVSYRRAGLASR